MVMMSALAGTGLREFETTLFNSFYTKKLSRKDIVLLSHWQINLFKDINSHIDKALNYIKRNYPVDFLCFSLSPALDSLARLKGEIVSEEILTDIFSNFCIGK
jgi:tRNA modification GTPase